MYDTEHKVGNDIYSALGCHPKSLARIGNGGNNKIFSFINRERSFVSNTIFKVLLTKEIVYAQSGHF